MNTLQEIERTVLALPVAQRALLAESILGSLPPITEDESEVAEMEEIDRRERQIESGQVQPLSEDEFLRRLESARRR